MVNQEGKTRPLAPGGAGSGWDLEATLDVSMISAACPHCKILVIEADSDSIPDLARTDVTAARMGAQVISNSYGARENAAAMSFAKDYRRAGHTVVASSGDLGFDAASFPANLAVVTAVGGTSLHRARNARGFTERVWDDPADFAAGGSGCSAYVRKPSWQHDNHCPSRTVADISAVASDIPIFNRFYGGWVTVAGTSAPAPFVAGAYGLAGNAGGLTPRWLYLHRRDFLDVTAPPTSPATNPAALTQLNRLGLGYHHPPVADRLPGRPRPHDRAGSNRGWCRTTPPAASSAEGRPERIVRCRSRRFARCGERAT